MPLSESVLVTSHNGTLDGAQEVATSFWSSNGQAIETLGIYAGGIMFYAIVVNFFYQILSNRVMFGATVVDGRRAVGGPLHGFLYLILFPLFSFAFFLLLSVALIFLGGEDQELGLTFTLAMAVVLAVRITAYFSPATSHDVAKMLPLGLLGVMLVQAEFANIARSLSQLAELPDYLGLVALYFGIVVLVEYLLRTIYLVVVLIKGDDAPPAAPPREDRPPRPSRAHGAERRRSQ